MTRPARHRRRQPHRASGRPAARTAGAGTRLLGNRSRSRSTRRGACRCSRWRQDRQHRDRRVRAVHHSGQDRQEALFQLLNRARFEDVGVVFDSAGKPVRHFDQAHGEIELGRPVVYTLGTDRETGKTKLAIEGRSEMTTPPGQSARAIDFGPAATARPDTRREDPGVHMRRALSRVRGREVPVQSDPRRATFAEPACSRRIRSGVRSRPTAGPPSARRRRRRPRWPTGAAASETPRATS